MDYSNLIAGLVIRKSIRSTDKNEKHLRHYKNPQNAIIGLTKFLITKGRIGDKCEIYDDYHGIKIGDLILENKGTIQSQLRKLLG